MKHLKKFNELLSNTPNIKVGDGIVTDLSSNGPNGYRSPFHGKKGTVVKIAEKTPFDRSDFLIDLSANGPEFVEKYKNNMYTSDNLHDFGGTHKWFEYQQISKI